MLVGELGGWLAGNTKATMEIEDHDEEQLFVIFDPFVFFVLRS